MTARLSVVIPSYNHGRFVAQAIRSVLDQSVDGLELVIVDDGSTDDSIKAMRGVLADYPNRATRLIEQENRGAHAAIMRGVETATAPVLAILNSDDHYLPGRLEAMLPEVESREHALAFSLVRLIDDNGRTLAGETDWASWYRGALAHIPGNPTLGFALLEANFTVTSGNFLFTRALYNALDGFSEHKFVHDWDFLARSLFYCEPSLVRRELMSYRVHGANTTESVRGLLKDECDGVVARYAALCARAERPPNPLAPHPLNWPGYFDRFVRTRRAFWDQRAKRHPIAALLAGLSCC